MNAAYIHTMTKKPANDEIDKEKHTGRGLSKRFRKGRRTHKERREMAEQILQRGLEKIVERVCIKDIYQSVSSDVLAKTSPALQLLLQKQLRNKTKRMTHLKDGSFKKINAKYAVKQE